jgi:hypothetical protein
MWMWRKLSHMIPYFYSRNSKSLSTFLKNYELFTEIKIAVNTKEIIKDLVFD